MPEKVIRFEIFGVFFVLTASVLMQNLYEWTGHTVLGIMFGSVNDSVWEHCKTLLLPYVIWSAIEIICVKPKFHRFAVCRILSLYFLGLMFITLCLIFSMTDSQSHMLPEFVAAVASVACSVAVSLLMYSRLEGIENYFAPVFCLLVLFAALYCSFTVFPPHTYIFMDRVTGMYGIIPDYLDLGAFALFNV